MNIKTDVEALHEIINSGSIIYREFSAVNKSKTENRVWPLIRAMSSHAVEIPPVTLNEKFKTKTMIDTPTAEPIPQPSIYVSYPSNELTDRTIESSLPFNEPLGEEEACLNLGEAMELNYIDYLNLDEAIEVNYVDYPNLGDEIEVNYVDCPNLGDEIEVNCVDCSNLGEAIEINYIDAPVVKEQTLSSIFRRLASGIGPGSDISNILNFRRL